VKIIVTTATSALLAIGLLAAAPASAETPEDVVCQVLDQYGPSDAVFNQFARSARKAGASGTDFELFMYDQMTLCPSYRDNSFMWQAGI
jgi:hypothetical protein